MIETEEWFSPDDYVDLLEAGMHDSVRTEILDLLDGDDLAFVLENGPIVFAKSLEEEGEQWLKTLPDRSRVLVDIFHETNQATNKRTNGWFNEAGLEPESAERMRTTEFEVYKLAKSGAKVLIKDERTQEVLTNGLTHIPSEVLEDFITEFYDDDEFDFNAVRGASEAIAMAIAVIASEHTTPREISERSLVNAFIAALVTERKLGLLEPLGYERPGEYFSNRKNITNGVFQSLGNMADSYSWSKSGRTSYDIGVDRLDDVIARAAIGLVEVGTERPELSSGIGQETEADQRLKTDVDVVSGFVMDIINARWQIRKIGPGNIYDMNISTPELEAANDQGVKDESEVQEFSSLEEIYVTLRQCRVRTTVDFETVNLFLTEGIEPRTGNTIPVEQLRSDILGAYRASRDQSIKAQLATALRDLQLISHQAASHEAKGKSEV